MKLLSGINEKLAISYINKAAEIASKSTCQQAKCGSVIIKNGILIGEGFNSPPRNLESQIRCSSEKKHFHERVTDKTCCVHAEQRAVMNALKNDPNNIEGSTLYFTRLDQKGKIAKAGKPYCTICSKMALDVGISEFVLWHEEGICVYNTEEYNNLSFDYQ